MNAFEIVSFFCQIFGGFFLQFFSTTRVLIRRMGKPIHVIIYDRVTSKLGSSTLLLNDGSTL